MVGTERRSYRRSLVEGGPGEENNVRAHYASRVVSQRRSMVELEGPETHPRDNSETRELGGNYSMNPLVWVGLATSPENAQTKRRDSVRRYG